MTVKLSSGDGVLPIGNVVLSNSVAGGASLTLATIPTAQAFASAGAVVPLTISTAGSNKLTATYVGDTTHVASSGAATVTVPLAVTMLSLKFQQPYYAGYVIVRPVLTGSFGIPTGLVTVTASLKNGTGTPIVVTTTAAAAAATNGVAVNLALAADIYNIDASYAGDGNNAASNYPSALIGVNAAINGGLPTFALSFFNFIGVLQVNPPTAYSGPSSSSPSGTEIDLTSFNGYNSLVNLTISDVPAELTAVLLDRNGKPLTTATPTDPGTYMQIVFDNNTKAASNHPPTHVKVYVCGTLFGLLFLGWRKRGIGRLAGCLVAILIVGLAGITLTGCDYPERTAEVSLTATPVVVSASDPPRTIKILVRYTVVTIGGSK